MVMTKTYHTVNGRILGETAGGVRTDYLTDALGSVTATVNASGAVVNRYRYKPYGALLSKTGVGADPKQQWVGSLGYRQTGKKYSDVYVRARHYDTANGRWTSKDLIGFRGGDWNLFNYVRNRSVDYVDPAGLQHGETPCCTDPNTDCYTQRNYIGAGGKSYLCCDTQSLTYQDVRSLVDHAISLMGSCFRSSKYTTKQVEQALGLLLTCVAERESSWDPHCRSINNAGNGIYGLFQIEVGEYDRCANIHTKMCGTEDNVDAALNKFSAHCKLYQANAYEAIRLMFACVKNDTEAELQRTKRCISKYGSGQTFDKVKDILSTVTCNSCKFPKGCY